jgi:hypothetical protein
LACFWVAALSWGDEPQVPPVGALEQRLDELEGIDQALAEAHQQLKTATTRAAHRQLKARILELKETQAALLEELEAFFGPPPTAVRDEPPLDLEQQLESQERHHDAILERDADRRLPTQPSP